MESLKTIFYWDRIAKIGKNRVVRSSYFWLLFVPIVAKILHGVESPLMLTLSKEYTLSLNLELPFSWQYFFISAVLISVANVLYFLFCPRLIQEYRDFSEFKNSGKDENHILELVPKSDIELRKAIEKEIKEEVYDAEDPDNELSMKELILIRQELISETFWIAWNGVSEYRYPVRVISWISYWLGILLFVYVILQNIIFVFREFIIPSF